MKLPRVLIGACASGSGKTMITCALLQLLQDREYQPRAFKCGPDYIDPLLHNTILGIPSRNLDCFFTDEETTKALFLRDAEQHRISIIEGVMGLYDGVAGIYEEASSYHLATITKTPIILVVDGHGMGRSLLAMIAGYLQYDHHHLIRGVILNRVSSAIYERIRPMIEEELGVAVVGYVPKLSVLEVGSRHLGLRLPEEQQEMRQQIKQAAKQLEQTLDLKALLCIADQAEPLRSVSLPANKSKNQPTVRIAIAQDEAFCFYYEDNLRLLKELGAELIPFSPIHDPALPIAVSGLVLGGGYPELHARQLADNESMRESIRQAIQQGMPSIAECGGFMYLHQTMEVDGTIYPMAGVLPARTYCAGKSVRFGYIEVSETKPLFLKEGQTIRGHEFHYFDSEHPGTACVARKPRSERSWNCVHATHHSWWGYPHLYYYSNPEYAASFLRQVQSYQEDIRNGA